MPPQPSAHSPTTGLSVVSTVTPDATELHIDFEREGDFEALQNITDRVTLTLDTAEWLLEELHAAVDNCRVAQRQNRPLDGDKTRQ